MSETIVTSPSGGQKGQKDAQLSAVDPYALLQLAKVAGYGTGKYDRANYLKGYDWHLCLDALARHTLAFAAGEDTDPESGLPHMAHAAWHCLALVSFGWHEIGTDTRLKTHRQKVRDQYLADLEKQEHVHAWLDDSEIIDTTRRLLNSK